MREAGPEADCRKRRGWMSHYGERMRQARLVFYEKDIEAINQILADFLDASQAKCTLLIDKEGHMVTKKGFTKSVDTDAVAALVAGSFASTKQLAELLGEEAFTVLFHQGRNEHIHVGLVLDRALVVIIFDDRTTIGMVRLYAEELTSRVGECLTAALERSMARTEPLVSADFEAAAQDRLDEFFGTE